MKDVFYPRHIYFSDDFPFCINRWIHTAADVNESIFHRRAFWKIFYVIAGSGEFLINSQRYELHANSVIVCHPDSRTTFHLRSPELHVCNIIFLPALIEEELRRLENHFDFFSIFSPEEPRMTELYVSDLDNRLRKIIHDLEQEFRRKESNYRTVIRMRLIELLVVLSRRCEQCFQKDPRKNVVQYLQQRIHDHFNGELDLDLLAHETGIGKTRLCLLFRRATGNTIMNALRKRRLAEARNLLCSTDAPIADICFRCGFQDLSHFYHLFRKEYDLTPLACRKQAGNGHGTIV